MSDRQHDLTGKPVHESKVAADLGFTSIWELQRWSTGLGMQVAELEYALKQAKDERDRFHDVGQQMMGLLNTIKTVLTEIHGGADATWFKLPKLISAIGVVSGLEPDFDGEIRAWLKELQAQEQAKIDDALARDAKKHALTDDEVDELLS